MTSSDKRRFALHKKLKLQLATKLAEYRPEFILMYAVRFHVT
jgi:hypothetical protein